MHSLVLLLKRRVVRPDLHWRDWYSITEQALAPHFAHLEECAALRIVLATVPYVSRSCEHFPDEFDLHLLQDLHHPEQLPSVLQNSKADQVKDVA